MQFPTRDLTEQFISQSYQDVVQNYIPSDILYFLDGYGNVLFSVPSDSIGQTVITSDVTASMTVLSSSYSVTASYAIGAVFGNVDGGFPNSIYGGVTPIDGGTP